MSSKNCTNKSRLDTFYKYLSLSSNTSIGYERVAIKSAEELMTNISFAPKQTRLKIKEVGEWLGPVDITEYIMLSWKEFNDGIFALKMRSVVGSRCISPNTVEYETLDSFLLSDGTDITSKLKTIAEYEPDTNLLNELSAEAPEELLGSLTTFEPRTLCDVAVLRCPGDLYPYESVQDCYDFMSTLPQACIPNEYDRTKGMIDEDGVNGYFQGDTVACRYLHLSSAALRPTFHCAHMSKDSSGKCVSNKCPSAVKGKVHSLTPMYDASFPAGLLWAEMTIAIATILSFVFFHIWFREQRRMLNRSTINNKQDEGEAEQTRYREFPELLMENISLSWTEKLGGKNVLELETLHLGGLSHQLTALTAASGTGKSSLLKLIAGFHLQHMELKVKRFIKKPKIILCDQFSEMWPKEMIVRDIFLFSSYIFGSELNRVRNVIEILGIDQFLDQTFGTLSGGQQQLVHISSALVSSHPSMIFLDEPFSSLDEKKSIQLMLLLRSMSNECGHSFVLVVHTCSDKIRNEFDNIINLDEEKVLNNKSMRGSLDKNRISFDTKESESIPSNKFHDNPISSQHRKEEKFDFVAELPVSSMRMPPGFLSEIKAIAVLWHAQFFGIPLIELSITLSGISGGLLIGYMGHGGFVSHSNVDYIPTEELIQSIYYILSCLLGMVFVSSFGVSLIYWSREAALVSNFNSQGIVRGSAYIIVNILRSMVSSFLLNSWVVIITYVLECESTNKTLLVANCAIFLIMWTTLCSFVCALTPIAYSAHSLLYMNSVGLVFSGIIFNWKYLYQGFKILHYANPIFLFSCACAYLFLGGLDAGCEDHDGLLHYGQCTSSDRALEMRGLPMVSSLVAQSMALLVTALSSFGMGFFILKGPK